MTFSWEIEDLDALQSIVKRELKASGIRISKKKDFNRGHHAPELHESPLFGKSLDSYLLIKDEASHCSVPRFLLECTKFLHRHLEVEGLFRVSGSKCRQRELQRSIENGGSIPADANPADVCSLFKQFFRNLPEPLLTPKLQSAYLKALQLEDHAEQRWIVLNLCYLLPTLSLQTLRFVTHFLRQVAQRADHNRMDASNLAKVFTPNLFGSFTAPDKKNPDRVIGLQTGAVRMLIDNSPLIGEVPDWLVEKVMSVGRNRSRELLTSEDELEKSDDNLDEVGTLHRRRRRKSGGSFHVLVSGLGHSLGILKSGTSTESVLSDATHCGTADSPRIMKRKASEDIGSAFTSMKRKAMLHKLTVDPQFSKPGLHLHKTHHAPQPHGPGTPMTPIQHSRPALGEADAVTADGETLFRHGTPSIVYADDSFAGHTPSRLAGSEMSTPQHPRGADRWPETPKSKLKRFKELSSKKLKRRSVAVSLDSESCCPRSPKGIKTPGNKRKETKDVGWRLANASPPDGGLDTMKKFEPPSRPAANFSNLATDLSSPGRPRRHVKAPSSPARLVTGASPQLTRSPRLTSSNSLHDMPPIPQPVFFTGDSPKVVIVDTHTRAVASPQVMIVDTYDSKEADLTGEYLKKQQEHTSQLMGSKMGQERTSPQVKIPPTTLEKLKAAEVVYSTLPSLEGEAVQKTNCPVNPEPTSKEMDGTGHPTRETTLTPSVSQLSLSSVLSGISTVSQRSEFSQFGMESQPKAPYIETDLCSPCVVDCSNGTNLATDSPTKSVAGNAKPIHAEPNKSESQRFEEGQSPQDNVHAEKAIGRRVSPRSSVAGVKGMLFKSDSLDSGKGQSLEDLHMNLEEAQQEVAPALGTRQDSVDAGVEVTDSKQDGEKDGDGQEVVKMEIPNQTDVTDKENKKNNDMAGEDHSVINSEKPCKVVAEIKKVCDVKDYSDRLTGSTMRRVNLTDESADKSSTAADDSDVFKVPKCVNPPLNDAEMQDLINKALKSDMKKSSVRGPSRTLPVHDSNSGRKRQNTSIVKANIQLFNSFSTSQEELRSRGSQIQTRSRSGSGDGMSRPLTPLTKSTSMDSGICKVKRSDSCRPSWNREMNESYMAAVGTRGRQKALSMSVSMENISTPQKDRNVSYMAAVNQAYPIQASQSMQDVSTPTSKAGTTQRKQPVRNVRSMQELSTPKTSGNAASPASIRRRRPVSHSQKATFQESDSFAKLKRQKVFQMEEEAGSSPLVKSVKPLGDNNSPQPRHARPAPLDPRRATPLTPIHPAQKTRRRPSGSSSSRGAATKHRSPVKPVKRLGKTPSPAKGRAKGRRTPERESRTPKRYPSSPKNPLDVSSPRGRKQRSAVPIHVQDEWEL